MAISVSALRANIYKVVDEALRTGASVEIVRNGETLDLVPRKSTDRLSRLKKRDVIVGDPEDMVHMNWSDT